MPAIRVQATVQSPLSLAALLLAIGTLWAGYLPARLAARLDQNAALRYNEVAALVGVPRDWMNSEVQVVTSGARLPHFIQYPHPPPPPRGMNP